MAAPDLIFKSYIRATKPSFAESTSRYLEDELRKIEATLSALTVAVKELDTRLRALEP